MELNLQVNREQLHSLRPKKQGWDPETPQGFLIEDEPDGHGGVVRAATYFLTGAECRFACAFCDLWKYTLDVPTPPGSLVRQIHQLHDRLAASGQSAKWLKLYNASNFFDTKNIPEDDLIPIAHACRGFDRVVVENHPSLLAAAPCRRRLLMFADAMDGELEVAMGLESIDPNAVSFLNKQMHLSEFESACRFLNSERIRSRAFVLLQPPGTHPRESVAWAVASCEYAFSRGVERCGIVPTRPGNGWLDSLHDSGQWSPPNADQLEQTMLELLKRPSDARHGTSLPSDIAAIPGISIIDLWDWDQVVGGCVHCRPIRYDTLQQMNLRQLPIPRSRCRECAPQ